MAEIIKVSEASELSEVCIFKSLSDAKIMALNTQGLSEDAKPNLVCIQSIDDSDLIKAVKDLSNEYDTLNFTKNSSNFSEKEIIKFSHYLDEILYECSGSDYKLSDMTPNVISGVLHSIKSANSSLFGFETAVDEEPGLNNYIEFFNTKNKIVKLYTKAKLGSYYLFFKVMTNYTIDIKNITILVTGEDQKEHCLQLKITDLNNTSLDFELNNKTSLNLFRQKLSTMGNFFDCFSQADFNQFLHQLCTQEKYPTIYKYNQPGLIADKKVWLLADEVISLEDIEETEEIMEDKTND
jgi:hypothetical protein